MAVSVLGTSLIYASGNSWEWARCERELALITQQCDPGIRLHSGNNIKHEQ